MKLPNWLYDLLKWLCILALPATKVAIPKLFEIWGWKLGNEIAETLDIIAVWLGTIVGIGCATYYASNKDDVESDLFVHEIPVPVEVTDDTEQG